MPTPNAIPNSVNAQNAPAFGPTGEAFAIVGITQSDLIAGVNVYADPQTGGQQTVRAIADHHYRAHDEQFFIATEEAAYRYLQVDSAGNGIAGRPVYSVEIGETIDELAAEMLTEAFANREINLEYAIARRTREIYSPELKLLSNGLISSGAANFTTVIDNTDSTLMRKRHGYDSAMINAMADLITRQFPVQGFLTSGTGPGNAIIEALRRCGITVAKQLTTNDRARGVATLTTRDIVDHFEKGYSHRNVALNHAWKYDRNRSGNLVPDLLDIEVASAILDLGRGGIKLKDGKTVRKLRQQIKDEQAKAAEQKAKNATLLLPMRRAAQVAPHQPTAEIAPPAQARPAHARTRHEAFEGGSLSAAIAHAGLRNPAMICQTITAIDAHDLEVPGRPLGRHVDDLVAFARTDELVKLANKASATCQRIQIKSVSAMVYAHVTFEKVNPEKAATFFAGMTVSTKSGVQHALIRRLHGLTKAERTPFRVLDYTLQAWAAHVAGVPLVAFVDSAELPPVAGMAVGAGANDNGLALDKAV